MTTITTGFAIIDTEGNIIVKSYGQTNTQYAVYNNINTARRILRNLRGQLLKMGFEGNEYRIKKLNIAVEFDD